MKTTKIVINEGQTIYDFAVLFFGNADAVAWILEDNESIDLDTVLEPGIIIKIRKVEEGEFLNKKIVNYYTKLGLQINTSDIVFQEGIDFWGIEFDFVIS